VAKRGLLHSDQELFNNASQDALVQQYVAKPSLFASDFVAAMIKMGNLSPLTGTQGEIRRNCRVVNS
jgi:peroxidase